MNVLHVAVGLPRSGKTTWAQSHFHPVVNPDSIRLALHGRPFIALAEPYVWAIAKTMVGSLFLAGHREVIVDATHTTRKRRDAWISDDWVRHFHVFECTLEKSIARTKATLSNPEHQTVVIEAAERMSRQWEDIEEDELREGEFVV